MSYFSTDSSGLGEFSCGAACSCKQCRSNLAEVYEEEEKPSPSQSKTAPQMGAWFGEPVPQAPLINRRNPTYSYNYSGLRPVSEFVHRRPGSASLGYVPSAFAGFGKATGPIFDVVCPNCPQGTVAQCRAAIRAAVVEAIRLATNAADRIDQALQVPPASRDANAQQTARFFLFFFGHDPSRPIEWAGNQESGVSVAARFRSVANELNGGRRITFHCEPTRPDCVLGDPTCCRPDVNASFIPAVPNSVKLCAGFWNPPANLRGLPGVNYRAAIIIHEMLHMLFEDLRDVGHGRARAACYEAFALRAAGFGADPFDVCQCRGTPCPP
jgi:lysine-specific metallo-endopeptidase family protein